MIQPVSTFSPRPVSRGSNIACGKSQKRATDPQIAVLNAGGAAVALGGLTAAIARSHTTSWANAIVLGMFGTFLSLFFMTPSIVSSKNKIAGASKTTKDAAAILKEDSKNVPKQLEKCLKPAKKIVQFRQTSS